MKTLDMLSNPLEKAITKFDIKSKAKLIGSNSMRGVLFGSDYDVETKLTGQADTLASHFQRVVRNLDGIYFMDMKAGLDTRLVYDFDSPLDVYLKNPLISTAYAAKVLKARGEKRVKLIRDLFILRWKPKDVLRGYVVLVDGTRRTLAQALQDDTMIKIDFVVPVGNTFAEVSENYTYRQEPPDPKRILQELENDVEMYRHNNTMKALKRLYSIMKMEDKNHSAQLKIMDFFNSDAGLVNKVANDLDLLLLLTSKHKVPWEKIKANLQMLKEKLGTIAWIGGKKVKDMDELTQSNFKGRVRALIDYLRSKLNPLAKAVLVSVM